MFGIFGKRKPLRIKSDPVTVTVTREVWDSTKEAWVPASRWDSDYGKWEPELDLREYQPFGHVTRPLDMSEFRPVNPSTLYDAEGNVVDQWSPNPPGWTDVDGILLPPITWADHDEYERILAEIAKVLDKTQATIILDGLNVWENL